MLSLLLSAVLALAPLGGTHRVPQCVDANCYPGNWGIMADGTPDTAFANVAAAEAAGFAACAYYHFTANLNAAADVQGIQYSDGAATIYAVAKFNAGVGGTTWPTLHAELTDSLGSTAAANFTANTTSFWAICLYAPNGTGEVGGARMWVYEGTGGTWTKRVDVTQTHADPGTTTAFWAPFYDGISSGTSSINIRLLYMWTRTEWNGVDYNSATADTNIAALIGCSVDSANSVFRHVWAFNSSSGAITDLRASKNMSTAGTLRATDPLWSNYGKGTSSECKKP